MTQLSYHDTVNDLQGLDFAPGGPFARADWFAMLEQAGAQPLAAVAQDASGALALLLTRNGKYLESLTNWYAFTWQDLATPRADRPTLAAALARDLRRHGTHLTLAKLPADSADLLRTAFTAAGWFTQMEPCDSNHVLPLAGRSYEQFMATRPGPLRTTLKRKAKKVEVEIQCHFDPASWAAYEAVYAESWKPEEGDPALLRRFAEAEGAAGRIRLGLARHEGQVVAAQFWTVEHGTAWIHKLAHLESAKPLSAGTTLSAGLFQRVIDDDRVELVDFGTGNDPYKRDWMEQVRTRYRLTCWRPEVPGNWPAIGKAVVRKLVSRRRSG
ncbi:MAG: GNAT family N-acetyltransferase [Croceibacterium sp.]